MSYTVTRYSVACIIGLGIIIPLASLLLSCDHGASNNWSRNNASVFRDCPYIKIYSAQGDDLVTITNRAEIKSLWDTFGPAFMRHGIYTSSIPNAVVVCVGYPYFQEGRTNICYINVHSDNSVSFMMTMKTTVVFYMQHYCREVYILCQRYGIKTQKAEWGRILDIR